MTDTTSGVALSQPLYGASIGQAVSRFFKKYATFSGRASRSEYWWVVLVLAIVNAIFSIVVAALGGYTPNADGTFAPSGAAIAVIVVWGIVGLIVLIPHIALTVRRLHDGNFSGWFYLFTVFGLGLVTLILTLLGSKPEGARFDK